MPKLKLVKGETYHIGSYVFRKDVEVDVDKETADYLKKNDAFEVVADKKKADK